MKPGDKSVCLLLLPFCVAFTWETVVAQWDFWMTDGRSFSIMCWRWEDSQLTGLCVKCLHIQEEFYLYVRKWAIYRWELFRSTSISWNLSLSYSIVFPFFFFFSQCDRNPKLGPSSVHHWRSDRPGQCTVNPLGRSARSWPAQWLLPSGKDSS